MSLTFYVLAVVLVVVAFSALITLAGHYLAVFLEKDYE